MRFGLGFADNDAVLCGYDPTLHRHFLVDYFTGKFPGSPARGLPFGDNQKSGDARISGALASLVGLECALERCNTAEIDNAIKTILLLHSIILSFGGIPLLYYGDAIGTLNNLEYLADSARRDDNRWINRSYFDWSKAERRHQRGTIEFRIFDALKKMIILRKENPAFADFDNRQLFDVNNHNLLVFSRTDPHSSRNKVLVVSNFNIEVQRMSIANLQSYGYFERGGMKDLLSGMRIVPENDLITLSPLTCLWLTES